MGRQRSSAQLAWDISRATELRNAFKADTGALPILKCSVRPAGTPRCWPCQQRE